MQAIEVPALVNGMMDFVQRSLSTAASVETRFAENLPPVRSDPVQARDRDPQPGRQRPGRDVGRRPDRHCRREISRRRQNGEAETRRLCAAGSHRQRRRHGQGDPHPRDDPFFTTKGVGKGTGLGLSMVQGLTEQSGGKLEIESQKGKGTTVSLYLPAADANDCQQSSEKPMPSPATVPRGRLTILAVDDDALVLMNTTLMLEDLGHTVIEAYSGADALKELRSGAHDIDLVITDHSMPRMTGSSWPPSSARKGQACRWCWRPVMRNCRPAATTACRDCPSPSRRTSFRKSSPRS